MKNEIQERLEDRRAKLESVRAKWSDASRRSEAARQRVLRLRDALSLLQEEGRDADEALQQALSLQSARGVERELLTDEIRHLERLWDEIQTEDFGSD